jgi:hypothetical protein
MSLADLHPRGGFRDIDVMDTLRLATTGYEAHQLNQNLRTKKIRRVHPFCSSKGSKD